MAKKACKCKETECEECPEWIFTFADLVMLMMGFFVILWVLKPAPGKDGEQGEVLPVELIAAIREAFGRLPDPKSNDPVDIQYFLKKLEQMKPLKGKGDGGKSRHEQNGAQGENPDVAIIRQGLQAGVGTRVLFAAGDARLLPESAQALDQIVVIIKGHTNVILVKGHTSPDDFPEGTGDDQKLELSIRRAKVVADYLVAHGIMPETLRVVGCSIYEPVKTHVYLPEPRGMNRRVEVEEVRTLVSELQDRPVPARPTSTATEVSGAGTPATTAHE